MFSSLFKKRNHQHHRTSTSTSSSSATSATSNPASRRHSQPSTSTSTSTNANTNSTDSTTTNNNSTNSASTSSSAPSSLSSSSSSASMTNTPHLNTDDQSSAAPNPQVQAQLLKEQGNVNWSQKKFPEAIQCYSQALVLCPSESVLWSNRALCRLKLMQIDDAIVDSKEAIKLDNHSVKAYYFLGQAYFLNSDLVNAVKSYAKAFELSKEKPQTKQFADDIQKSLFYARKKLWEEQKAQCALQNKALRNYLQQAMAVYRDKQSEDIRRQSTDGASASDAQQQCTTSSTPNNDVQQNELVSSFLTDHQIMTSYLEALFLQEEERQRPKEIPDCFCCKITMDIIRDPVITPSGISYERSAIEEHLRRGKYTDPVSGKPLSQKDLVPNLALRDAIEFYLQENPWAFPDLPPQ